MEQPQESQRPWIAETHVSWVFLTPTRAYKLLKPVSLGFLDHRSSEDRLRATTRELELNQRFAPDVYLGLADVEERGEVVDRMIVMQRMPDDRRLSALVGDDNFGDHLRSVARMVAAFHSSAPIVRDAPMASCAAQLARWEDNLDVIAHHTGTVIELADHERLETLVRTYLNRRQPLFDSRVEAGLVRDGHGDLIADDVFCLDDGPRAIDCLAFSDEWRIGDVLNDIGFLVMDIDRLAGADHAAALMRWYQEFSNEHHPQSLAHHYIAYRAHVRAKVACLRYAQVGDEATAELARTYHGLALQHLERGRLRMVLTGGTPGVGKSTLAKGISNGLGMTTLVSDEIRKDITGTPRTTHRFAAPHEGIYDRATTDTAYTELLREAELLLGGGHSVVLDATWSEPRHRAAAREVAIRTGAEITEFECVLPPGIAKDRITHRMDNPGNVSDATPALVDRLTKDFEPWPSAIRISTESSPAEVTAEALAHLCEPPSSSA